MTVLLRLVLFSSPFLQAMRLSIRIMVKDVDFICYEFKVDRAKLLVSNH